MIPLFRPCLDHQEEEAIVKVLRSGWIGNGPKTEELEKKFSQFSHTRYAVGLNSATAALHLALLTSIKPGDEVISSSLTFVASNQAILLAGGRIVFADIDPETLCLEPRSVLKRVTSKTKAILVTHYGGHPVDMDPILKLCRQKKISLIEDCAHAAGARYKNKPIGSFGKLGCFSFAAIKNITAGDGGMLVTNDRHLAERVRRLAWSGISSTTWQRTHKGKTYKWQYQVKELGFKYQMNDITAAIALVQLKKLPKTNQRRAEIAQRYNQAFKNIAWIQTSSVKPWAKSSHHNYFIKVPAPVRNRLIDHLTQQGISTSVHYVPNHFYPMFKTFRISLPVTETIWRQIILLPIFPDLARTDQTHVIQAVKSFKI